MAFVSVSSAVAEAQSHSRPQISPAPHQSSPSYGLVPEGRLAQLLCDATPHGYSKVQRVVHFNEYAILLAAALAARKGGIPTTFMGMASIRGVDRRRIVFIRPAGHHELPQPFERLATVAEPLLAARGGKGNC